uniref:RIN4 pathogenic type III effector avirulence factor Avr cleavage site domain-containing protein n=1 Tax=Leersia perrieri TaxID=77586 RepID=A0A0D9VD57_9ORYZ
MAWYVELTALRFVQRQGPVVPKFGSWDAENIGYTVFFDKVRENKTTPTPASSAPPPATRSTASSSDYEFDPYEHYENLSRNVPSRPPSSSHAHHHHHRHPPPPPHHHHYPTPPASHRSGNGGGYHRRSGSNGSSCAPSEASSRGSKFSPPKPYQPRYTTNNNSGGGGGGGGGYDYGAAAYAPAPQRHHYQHQQVARVVAASPPRHHAAPSPAPVRKGKVESAVPKFGVWDEQNAAAAGQGFTVQFEKVKRHREVAKAAAAAPAPAKGVSPRMSPETGAAARRPRRKAKKSFLSKARVQMHVSKGEGVMARRPKLL